MIAFKAVDEEKPYHRLEKCAQNDVDRPVVSCGLLLCEDCPAGGEESDVSFEEPCQLPELVNYGGCMEGELGMASHK